MLLKTVTVSVLSLAMTALAIPASAAIIIDMEGIAPSRGNSLENSSVHTFNGFDIFARHGHFWDSAERYVGNQYPDNGTDYFLDDNIPGFQVTKVGGGTFSVRSFDASEFDSGFILQHQFTARGHQFGGGIISQTFSTDNIFAFETFNLSASFINLTQFDLEHAGGLMAWDNIVIEAPVPEPSTYVMAAMSLLGLGLMSRRRKGGWRSERSGNLMVRALPTVVALFLLAPTNTVEAAFINGVEGFDGTELDLETWEVRNPAYISQDDELINSTAGANITTRNVVVRPGDTVTVDIRLEDNDLHQNGAAIYLTSNSGGVDGLTVHDSAYLKLDMLFNTGNFSGARGGSGTATGQVITDIPNHLATYTLGIERIGNARARYFVNDANGLLGETTLSFAATPDDLFISLENYWNSDAFYDNVTINGGGVPVPEPSTYAMAALGLVGLVGCARKRRRHEASVGQSPAVQRVRTGRLFALGLTLVLATAYTQPAEAIVLDFDYITPNNTNIVPGGYGGLWWDNMSVNNTARYDDPNGYVSGTVSPDYVAFNRSGDPSGVWMHNGDPFDFNGAYLTAAWRNELNIVFDGYFDDDLLYSRTVVVSTYEPTYFAFDFFGVNEVRFASSDGVDAGTVGNGTHFAMDNFTYNEAAAVPEPSTYAMAALGLLGLGFIARRRNGGWRRKRAGRPLAHGVSAVFVLVLLTQTNSAHAITIDWATIGDAGNAGENNFSGYGSVGYKYRISKHEVTNAQYMEFLNATAATDPFALYNTEMGSKTFGGITRSGSSGTYSYAVKADAVGQGPGGSDYAYADKPVLFVSWYDTIRFANWLTSGDTESGTYTFIASGPNAGVVTIPDHSTLGAGSYFLPLEDEWYKAAYYDGGTSTYFDYATGTDTAPNNNLPSADTGNSANFDDRDYTTGDFDYPLTDVGAYGLSASPYGTFDQSGNVWEWNETLIGPYRGVRGGAWNSDTDLIGGLIRGLALRPAHESGTIGFRIAATAEVAVPEPSTYVMAAMGLLGLLTMTRRRH